MNSDWVLAPLTQYGFLGLSAVLLALVFWLIRKLLTVLEAANGIIAANTKAISDLTHMTSDLIKLNRSLHDKIISRPCIAQKET